MCIEFVWAIDNSINSRPTNNNTKNQKRKLREIVKSYKPIKSDWSRVEQRQQMHTVTENLFVAHIRYNFMCLQIYGRVYARNEAETRTKELLTWNVV